MIEAPERALPLLESVRRARGVRNRAALAVSRWKAPEPPRPPREPEPDLVDAPPTLAALELAWSLESDLALGLMTAAIGRHGFGALKPL